MTKELALGHLPDAVRQARSLKTIAQICSWVVVAVGCVVMLGWAFDIDVLKSVIPGRVTMKPNTAVGLITSGIALCAWHWSQRRSGQQPNQRSGQPSDPQSSQRSGQRASQINLGKSVAFGFAIFTTALGLVTLIEYGFGIDFGIDELIFEDAPDAVDALAEGRMAPNTALSFTLIGAAIGLLTRRAYRFAQGLSAFVLLIALLALTGHLYAVALFYSAASYTGMAIHTAIAFTLLSISILITSPYRGWMREVSSPFAGGIMARRFIPIMILLPMLLGLFILSIYEGFANVSTETAIALRSLLGTIIFLVIVWWNARSLNRIDAQRQQELVLLQQATEELRRREQEFSALVEHSPDVIARYDRQFRTLYINPAMETESGLPTSAFIHKTLQEVGYPEAFATQWNQWFEETFQTGEPKLREFSYPTPNGWRTYQTRVVPEFNSEGEVETVFTITRDITALHQIETDLRASEARLLEAQRIARIGSWELDTATRKVRWTEEIFWLHGFNSQAGEPNYKAIMAKIVPKDRLVLEAAIDRAIAQGEPYQLEYGVKIDGHLRYVEARGRPVRDEQGRVHKLVGTVVDITERKQAEIALNQLNQELEAKVAERTAELSRANAELRQEIRDRELAEQQLQAREEQFRRAVINSPFPIFIHQEDGEILQISQSVTDITGYALEDIPTIADWTERAYGERRNEIKAIIAQLYDLDRRVDEGEFTIRTQSGEQRIWAFSSAPLGQPPQGQRLVISMAADITLRKQAETALANRLAQQAVVAQLGQEALSDLLLDTLFDQAAALVADNLQVDYCKILELLPDGEQMLVRAGVGWHEGIVGHATVPIGHESQAGYTLRSLDPIIVTDLRTETRFSGPALLHEHHVTSGISTAIRGGDAEQPFGVLGAHTVAPRQFTQDDVNFLQTIANLLASAIARQQARQEIVELNITLEQRVQERTQQLQTVNKELEAFSYSVAHDLRSPLRAIQGFGLILQEDYADQIDDMGQEFIQRMVASAERMDTLIQDLLSYSRLGRIDVHLQPISLQAVVQGILQEIDLEIQQRQADITIVDTLPVVRAQRSILAQVITNLLTNAMKFVEDDVQPVIQIWAEEFIRSGDEAKSTRWVRLWIEDNGIGIAPQHQQRIFNAFERLHGIDTYVGTGIGLAIAKRGTERMGGRIGLESAEHQGSRFWIELPRLT